MNRYEGINYSELELLSYSGGSDNHGLLNATPATVVTSSQPCLASLVKAVIAISGAVSVIWASEQARSKNQSCNNNNTCYASPTPPPPTPTPTQYWNQG